MSLTVFAYRRDPSTGERIALVADPEPGSELAGFERWRFTVWGSELLRELGLTVLPRLADGGELFVEDDELDRLAVDLDILLADLPWIATTLGIDPAGFRFRTCNIWAALQQALQAEGGYVYIA